MMQYKLVPILAHPERYTFVQQDPELIYDLIERGVLMQANYASILGYYGSKAQVIVRKFLENNMIHFFGTDVHRANTIYPKMPQILEKLTQIIGKQKLEELSNTNPRLVLQNKRIDFKQPNKIELTLKEKMMMKWKRK